MPTVAISDDTDDKIEELQKQLDFSPTKKEILGEAIEQYHSKKVEDGN